MAYLHARNVVHADLKCQNVLLTSAPWAPWGVSAKISDFGLSKALGLNQTHVTTHSMGTVTHMPPELFKTGRMSPAGDVYAFGVLAWEVLTGRGAFHGLHYAEVIEQVALRGARPPIPPGLPPELSALMQSCWQADPAKRPGFDALVSCFELLIRGCGLDPTPAGGDADGSSSGVGSLSRGLGRGRRRSSDGRSSAGGAGAHSGSTSVFGGESAREGSGAHASAEGQAPAASLGHVSGSTDGQPAARQHRRSPSDPSGGLGRSPVHQHQQHKPAAAALLPPPPPRLGNPAMQLQVHRLIGGGTAARSPPRRAPQVPALDVAGGPPAAAAVRAAPAPAGAQSGPPGAAANPQRELLEQNAFIQDL
ncbi:hypothetical protein MNEG_8725 [Monoraphidium neglectum]|uniref:Protein kinase domain-containing protein n=1 Tax=Monoraphidium neglectum TaxID=145388 RepID=A0A0D2M799_9CHLO|nr:hypothetical protein MNEG_8725 [Monoraphidium neglectum]KIY99239.1 hypothetical protein MNEG_8725 [Monoraphidium neglectum]|eukprot:XP_013898259.1 hypothetical protein MNEG_8725 [Monoraphidium neglectum]